MNRLQRSLANRFAFGVDPLDDPLNDGWDEIVSHDRAPVTELAMDDMALLRRMHTLEAVSLPSPNFLGDLEQRLMGLYPGPVAPRQSGRPSRTAFFQDAPQAAPAPRPIPRPHRWTSMHSALAVVSVMLVVSLLVLYQAVPGPSEPPPIPAAVIAKPSMETIAQFEFVPPMWGLPDATAWGRMETAIFSVAPTTSFTTDLPFYTSVDGPLLLTVLSGELTVTPAGSALFYPANQSSKPPVEVSAGSDVPIGPNDTLVYSAVDAAIGSNPGSESALVLYGLVGIIDHSLPGAGVDPTDVSFISFDYADSLAFMPTNGAAVTLQRLELAPFDSFVFEPDADLWYLPLLDPAQREGLHIGEGALEGLAPQSDARQIYGAAQLRYLPPGPHTIINLGDKTASFYFLVVEPLPDGATPAA